MRSIEFHLLQSFPDYVRGLFDGRVGTIGELAYSVATPLSAVLSPAYTIESGPKVYVVLSVG